MGITQSYYIIPPDLFVPSNRRVLAVEWETRKGLYSHKGSPSEWIYLYKDGVKQEPPRPVLASGARHGVVVFDEEDHKLSLNTKYTFRWYNGKGFCAKRRKESRGFDVINIEAEERRERELKAKREREAAQKWISLPENTKEKITEVFQIMDKDGDRTVSKKELAEFVSNLGLEISMADIDQMFKDGDADGSMSLDFDEYKRAIVDAMEYTSSTLWRQIFLLVSEKQSKIEEPSLKRRRMGA